MNPSLIYSSLNETKSIIKYSVLCSFIEVESGGVGFDSKTGKLLIQFEPVWFKRQSPYAPSGAWSVNKVEVQSKEWIAFNDAFKKDKEAAMSSTSIGLPQIMGFHWKRLGYSSVGAMWDDFKTGEIAQIKALIAFIETDSRLLKAILDKNWHMVATIYNGARYKELAKQYNREPYDVSLQKAFEKYEKLNANHTR